MIKLKQLYEVNFGWDRTTELSIWDDDRGIVEISAKEAVLAYGDRLVLSVRNKCIDLSNMESMEDEDVTLLDLFFVNLEWERETELVLYDGENTIVTSVAEAPASLMLRKVEVYYGAEVKLENEKED